MFLNKLRFAHIIFTGSSKIGKYVRDSAWIGTKVTLELGGKNFCIVDETADVKSLAKKVASRRFFNCGQTCITPDTFYVH